MISTSKNVIHYEFKAPLNHPIDLRTWENTRFPQKTEYKLRIAYKPPLGPAYRNFIKKNLGFVSLNLDISWWTYHGIDFKKRDLYYELPCV